jgi:hypothetical protein
MTCLKWLRLLNEPLKKSCVVFITWEHVIVVHSFDALFGLTWRMLTTYLTLTSLHIASMIIWFLTCDTTLCFG